MLNDMLMVVAGSSGVVIEFSGLTINPDLYSLAYAKGYRGTGPVIVRVLAGADVGALVIPDTFPDAAVYIVNNGRIGGRGGISDSRGGTGIYTRRKITITNNGTIFGGGGGGGRGGDAQICAYSACSSGSGGSGGAGGGYVNIGGVIQYNFSGLSGFPGYSSNIPGVNSASGGYGGSGGNVGTSGFSGSSGSASGTAEPSNQFNPSYSSPGSGGPAGYYVDGNSYVTWAVTGTRLGNVI